MKSFYSFLDAAQVKYAPQPLQHLANGEMAKKLGGKIIFYTAEDFKSLATQGVIKSKILEEREEEHDVGGVIFFSIKQFFYSGRFNFKFLKFILEKGYEVHFAKENLSICDHETLEKAFPILYAHNYVIQRDEKKDNWDHILDKAGIEKVNELRNEHAAKDEKVKVAG